MMRFELCAEEFAQEYMEQVESWWNDTPAHIMFADVPSVAKMAVAEFLANREDGTLSREFALTEEDE